MSTFLDEILEHKRQVIDEKKEYYATLKEKLSGVEHNRYSLFKKQISKNGSINLIAEVKKASPSKGVIRDDFDPLVIASIYEKSGAAAISVLTEEKYFLGKPAYLKKISDDCSLPMLMKDFFVDVGQIYEARFNGASAILLIVAALDDETIKQFLETAASLDLDCLVEVHDEEELSRAIDCGAEIVGINNRNLKTFEVDLNVAEGLIPKIPKDKVIVAESGISNFEEVERLKELGANAVLIGETFMKNPDIGAKVKEVMHGES